MMRLKPSEKIALSFANIEHAMNGTAAADPTLETHNTIVFLLKLLALYSKLHTVEESIQRGLIDTLCFTIYWIFSISRCCT